MEYEDALNMIEEEAIPEEQSVEEEDEGFEESIQVIDLTVPGLQQGTGMQGTPQRSSTLSRPTLSYPTEDEYRQMMEYQGQCFSLWDVLCIQVSLIQGSNCDAKTFFSMYEKFKNWLRNCLLI